MGYAENDWLTFRQVIEHLRIMPEEIEAFIKKDMLAGYVFVDGKAHKIDDYRLSNFAVYRREDVEKLDKEWGHIFEKQSPEDLKQFFEILEYAFNKEQKS